MHANSLQLNSTRLPTTVRALRNQLAQLAETLENLERDLVKKEEPAAQTVAKCSDGFGYVLFGQAFHVSNGNQLLIEVLRHFAELDPGFPERYSAIVGKLGRKRPYVARTPQALYPGRPKLLLETVEFGPGWFVGTNEGNDKKLKLLELACGVIGIQWNKDLLVHMS